MDKCEYYIPEIDTVKHPNACILDNGVDVCPYRENDKHECPDYIEWIDPVGSL